MTAKIGAFDYLETLLAEWRTHLRARNRSKATIESYTRCAVSLRDFLVEHGMPTSVSAITREHIEAFLAHLADTLSPATTAKHYRSLQQLFRWLEDDGELPRSPMHLMRPPAVPEQPVPILTDEQLLALLATSKGNSFENRRDSAIIRLLTPACAPASWPAWAWITSTQLKTSPSYAARAIDCERAPSDPRRPTPCAATTASGFVTRTPTARTTGSASSARSRTTASAK